MSKGICVNTSSQEFKSLMNLYDISSGDLELALHQLSNAGNDMSMLELSTYIETYFKINSSYVDDDVDYEKLISIYDDYEKIGSILDKAKALLLFNLAKTIFGDLNVRIFNDTKGNYRIGVAKPINRALIEEYNEILKNAPRDSLGRLLAPNGKLSNLTESQYAQVRTKVFKEWFGDWENDPANASKVVDENDEPLVVYHTRDSFKGKDFNIFDTTIEGKKSAIYATNDRKMSSSYWKFGNNRKVLENLYTLSLVGDINKIDIDPFTGEPFKNSESYHYTQLIKLLNELDIEIDYTKNTYTQNEIKALYNNLKEQAELEDLKSLFVNIKNPIIIEGNDAYWNKIIFGKEILSTRKIEDKFRNSEYDGIIFKNIKDWGGYNVDNVYAANVYAMYNPNQVKSATENIGTFSTTNNRIDRFTELINDTINYLELKGITINKTFEGSDIKSTLDDFKSTLNKVVESYQDIHHYDLGFAEIPFDELESSNNTSDSYYQYLQKLSDTIINKLLSLGKSIQIIPDTLGSIMSIDSSGNTIKLYYNPNLLFREINKLDYILAHELVHSVTSNAINNTVDNIASKEEQQFNDEVWNIIVDLYNNKQFPWEFGFNLNDKTGRASHIKEFIANVMTNPKLQRELALIKIEGKNKSLWNRFINAVKNLLNKYLGLDITDSYLEKLMNTVSSYIENLKSNIGNATIDYYTEGNNQFDIKKEIINKIKEFSQNHVTFNAETHTYYFDGQEVDTTASKEAHGEINIPEEYKVVSSRIGNAVDKFGRIFFNKNISEKERLNQLNSISNLNRMDKNQLFLDFQKFKQYLDDKLGENNYEIVTDEIPIVSKYRCLDKDGKPITKTIGGTIDILVVDNKGNLYIYDMKTKRINNELEWREGTKTGYDKLLMIYKAMLEANWPELAGKIKELKLIRFDVSYPSPIENEYSVDDELLILDGVPILNHGDYTAPTLSTVSNGLINVTQTTLKNMEFEALENEDKSLLEEELGEEKELPLESPQNITQTESLYNPGVISATERRFLTNTAMYYASYIITQLQNSSKANSAFFGKEFTGVDFTKMSRKDIINYIGIPKILNYIKEAYFNPDNRDDIENFNVLDKLEVIYNNWGAATMSAYSKLISLEDVTIIPTEEVKKDDISFNDEDLYDSSDIEEKEREYWQVGLRQVSARSSLSIELRRIFERMPIVDSEGNYVTDEYGYGFMTFIDSGKAIDSIYNWVTGCTTMSEMEKVLTEKAEFHPWLNTILDKIKEEPLRSKFFHNFRKQNTKYSVITVDTDEKGNKSYNVNIINTSEPSKVLLERVTTAYNEGLLKNMIIPLKGSIDGKGKVNVDSVTKMKSNILKLISDVSNKLAAGKLHSYLNNPKKLQEFVNILNDAGIIVDIDTLKEAFSKDSKYKNKENTNVFKILKELMYITDTLLEQKDNPAYNPIEKGTEHNIYGNYRNIVNILSDYIHDSIEASTYENGKMYYSFVLPSYMGKLIDNLKNTLKDKNKFDKFIQSEYGRYRFFKDGDSWKNEWLKQLVRNPKMREVLDYKTQLMYDGVDYTELSELGYTLSLMQEYFYDKNKKYAWYRIPILANKPSSEFVKFTRYSGLRYREQILAGLKNVFDQELMRIKTVLERVNNDDINKIGTKDKIVFDLKESMITDSLKKKIKNRNLTIKDFVKNKSLIFHGSGAEFKFLDVLNNELIEGTELGQLIIDKINGKKVNEEEFNKLFNDAIKSYMNNIVSAEINHWRYIGLFDTVEKEIKGKDGKKETIKKYKYVSNLGKNEEEIKSNLEEYIWNDMFATINIIELTATDLAYYKNVEEFQKRYMQIHAPSMKFNTEANVLYGSKHSINGKYSADGMERTIYLADCIEKSEIIDNIKIAFDNKIATLSGIEKEHMKMTRDMVLSEFEKINVADAQGYSSPTSYRKKMGMSGRWTEEMEEAYNRIVSGNYNTNDLNIIWQPLKPFVYSQIPKSSGATTMKELKVPVQNKNSEYMLFLADAIMRGDSQKNKLVAIFDFMEDSAFDGRVSDKGRVIKQGKYNGVGIDTVQFVSAVNSGSMGAIDINDIDDYETIKQRLNGSVYYNSDKSETSDNAMDRYNDQYVHTIPYEDYGLQQEVPAHLVDHEQLMGSQMRILSISDITPGTKFEVNGEIIDDKSLIDEYQNLIAKNINESFEQLIKEFKIKGTRKEKNKALSDLLVKTILKDQRYGSDLLRACSLDKDGEFIIPLSDPIQSTRIQQLLNSIIKDRINKQTITGGPVVQVSSFGLSDDLKIVFDENDKGKVKYFECYMPIPSKELEKALTKSDGSLMTMEEAIKKGIITENMRKAIGARIPTEHKYSMAPLMIKGFLPKSAGEGIMLPKEITKLAGSDFDVDKLYVMLKSFDVKTVFNTDKFIKDIKATMQKQGISKEEINKFINGDKVTEDSVASYINKIRNGISFSAETDEYKEDKKGLFIYDLYTKNKAKYESTAFVEITDFNRKEGRNNRIFDLQWAVITSKDAATQLFNFGSFDVQKKSARRINLLKTGKYTYNELKNKSLDELDDLLDASSSRNIVFSSTQVYFHKQNMTAGKLIGIFANNNTSHAFLSMQDISLNISEEDEFMFDGVAVNNSENNKLDALYGKNGELISKNIAGYLAASVDAVKDPVLNSMNLNTLTANVSMLLARLGFDTDSIGMFLTQPIIENITQEYFKRNNEGYVSLDELIEEHFDGSKELIEGIGKSLKTTPFTKEDLAEGIRNGSEHTDFQDSALVLFGKLFSMAQDLNTLTFITKFNSVTNAVGPTIADTIVMRERYNKFMDKMNDNPPFSDSAKYVLENSPILNAFYDTTLSDRGAAKLIFQNFFPHYSDMFSMILSEMREAIKGNLDAKTINKLVNEFILYKLTLGDNPVIDSSYSTRNRYINKFVSYFMDKSKEISNNEFLNIINMKSRTKRCPVSVLEARVGGYSADLQERIKSSWSDLILNPDTRKLGLELFYYNAFRSGFGFSPKTFGTMASVDVKLNVPGYVDTIRNPEFNDEEVYIHEFIIQFLRNHTTDYKLVPRLDTDSKNVASFDNLKGKGIAIHKSYAGSVIVKSTATDTVFAPVIVYNDKVYILDTFSKDMATYLESTPLGNPNNFLEYGPEGSEMETVLGLNVSSEKEVNNEPSNSNVPLEHVMKTSFTTKELNAVLNDAEEGYWDKVRDILSGEESNEVKSQLMNDILDSIMEELHIDPNNEGLRKVISKKVKEHINKYC